MSPDSKMNAYGADFLPLFVKGEVVTGFGRGGKQLNCPTANYSEEIVDSLPENLVCGVYCGFAMVDDGPLYKAVLSVGWNPYYKNTKKTLETHLMHVFDADFYDSTLKLVITGFIREMADYNSLQELKQAIADDIKQADSILTEIQREQFIRHEFFAS